MMVMEPPAAVDVQVDDVVVELSVGQVESDTAKISADVRFSGQLPRVCEPQASHARVDLYWLGQAPVRAGEGDGRRQGPDDLG